MDGIHLELHGIHMESIWNPHGFHVEYGGRVKPSKQVMRRVGTNTDRRDPVVIRDRLYPDAIYGIRDHI